MKQFIHLNNYSDYSLRESTMAIEQLINKAKKLNMPAIALTDKGSLAGTIPFYKTAKRAGIKPIIGCEIEITHEKYNQPVILLAKNHEGYQNLLKIVSKHPNISWETLKQYSSHLICLFGQKVQPEIEYEKLKEIVFQYLRIFRNDLYLNVQNHGLKKKQQWYDIAKRLSQYIGVPIVATNQSCFLEKDHWEACKYIHSLKDKMINSVTSEHWLKSADEMASLFSEEELNNSIRIAEKCNVNFDLDKRRLPIIRMPENDYDAVEYLRDLIYNGLENRYENVTNEINERVADEIDVIEKKGLVNYFIILHDLCNWARKCNINFGTGRSPATSSLICYVLNITNIDPIQFGLVAERFINLRSDKLPRFSMDVEEDKRQVLIKYIQEKYGYDCVTCISTYGKITDRYLEKRPELSEFSTILEGTKISKWLHAASIVITPDSLTNYLPLDQGRHNQPVTQYDCQTITNLGLMNINILSLETLSEIKSIVNMINKNGVSFDINNIDLNDPNTLGLFESGNTEGIYQYGSPGIQNILKKLQPLSFNDLMAIVALYFFPDSFDLFEKYIMKKQNSRSTKYQHPALEPILKNTYGMILYHEQILQIINRVSSFSMVKSDAFRQAIRDDCKETISKLETEFIYEARAMNIAKDTAQKILNDIKKSLPTCRSKSIVVTYALTGYQVAYLKSNYPEEFRLVCSD